jgi:succinyl-diaminopimelate desuccinylase
MTDLLALAAELVDIPSESFHETDLADRLEAELRGCAWLDVHRIGDNVVARTDLGRSHRVALVGHTDTVPANGNARAVIDGDMLHGLGACDMKGGLAAMLDLARTVSEPAVDVTYVFYACEEVALQHNGLRALFEVAPQLLVADCAVLGEPTSATVEAGCQGSMRARLTMRGERAHTARPWMGTNAIHRLGPVLDRLSGYEARSPLIDGCEYHEALQAVAVEGGVAGNVVPDEAVLVVNHRFAPDRTADEAAAHVEAVLGPVDHFEVTEVAPPAPPSLGHPLLRALVDRNRLPVRAKLGWTDVAFFAEQGVAAANFGAGDPTLAHTAGEHVSRTDIEAVRAALADLVTRGAG